MVAHSHFFRVWELAGFDPTARTSFSPWACLIKRQLVVFPSSSVYHVANPFWHSYIVFLTDSLVNKVVLRRSESRWSPMFVDKRTSMSGGRGKGGREWEERENGICSPYMTHAFQENHQRLTLHLQENRTCAPSMSRRAHWLRSYRRTHNCSTSRNQICGVLIKTRVLLNSERSFIFNTKTSPFFLQLRISHWRRDFSRTYNSDWRYI